MLQPCPITELHHCNRHPSHYQLPDHASATMPYHYWLPRLYLSTAVAGGIACHCGHVLLLPRPCPSTTVVCAIACCCSHALLPSSAMFQSHCIRHFGYSLCVHYQRSCPI